jgi:hypothetical protein
MPYKSSSISSLDLKMVPHSWAFVSETVPMRTFRKPPMQTYQMVGTLLQTSPRHLRRTRNRPIDSDNLTLLVHIRKEPTRSHFTPVVCCSWHHLAVVLSRHLPPTDYKFRALAERAGWVDHSHVCRAREFLASSIQTSIV